MDFETLYNMYYKQVFSYTMTLTHNRDFAEEITQETFMKAMTHHKDFKKDASEFTWLCQIAKHQFIDEIRKQKHLSDMPEDYNPASDTDLTKELEDADSSYRIHVILHDLEEPYKEVFQLRVFGELSFLKIGTIFKKTENWARVTYHRAKLRIAERMENHESM